MLAMAIGVEGCSSALPVGHVDVADGVEPRMTAAEVADRVAASIDANEQQIGRALAPAAIDGMIATTADQVSSLEPTAPALDVADDRVVWVVRAHGTFVGLRGPTPDAPASETGFLVISDADGTTLATGFP